MIARGDGDRREGMGRLAGLEFGLIDTAGLEEAEHGSLEARMRAQTEKAIALADLTLLVFDAREGITPQDKFFATAIRKSGASVLLVGNKCEGKAGVAGIAEAWGLGFGAPITVSAAHGDGLGDLHDACEIATGQGRLNELTGEVRIYSRMKKTTLMKVTVRPISGSIRGPSGRCGSL